MSSINVTYYLNIVMKYYLILINYFYVTALLLNFLLSFAVDKHQTMKDYLNFSSSIFIPEIINVVFEAKDQS